MLAVAIDNQVGQFALVHPHAEFFGSLLELGAGGLRRINSLPKVGPSDLDDAMVSSFYRHPERTPMGTSVVTSPAWLRG